MLGLHVGLGLGLGLVLYFSVTLLEMTAGMHGLFLDSASCDLPTL